MTSSSAANDTHHGYYEISAGTEKKQKNKNRTSRYKLCSYITDFTNLVEFVSAYSLCVDTPSCHFLTSRTSQSVLRNWLQMAQPRFGQPDHMTKNPGLQPHAMLKELSELYPPPVSSFFREKLKEYYKKHLFPPISLFCKALIEKSIIVKQIDKH